MSDKGKGFASMDKDKVKEIAAEGGRASHGSSDDHNESSDDHNERSHEHDENDSTPQSDNDSTDEIRTNYPHDPKLHLGDKT